MLFNSLEFLLFFPVVTALYFWLPHRLRWALLLVASCGFYMAFIPYYILILLALIGIDYVAGLLLDRPGQSPVTRKCMLMVSILATCLVLGAFKYFNFFNANVEAIAHFLGLNYPIPMLALALPIGLSFHTFQSLSYVVEVYRGKQKAERHLGVYALYVMFYPQLVAGPIERPQNMLPQFHEVHVFDPAQVSRGLRLMLWGLFKKVVIADRLAIAVDHVYGDLYAFQGFPLLLVTAFFALQIYCDFSGYTDMATGAAQVMGFRLMKNFERPYFASSMTEFWKRWHISLSSWFRDYIFLPLTGKRASMWKLSRNLMITFLISGLWHGAGWTFVVYGALNGLYLVVELWTGGLRMRLVEFTRLDRHPILHRVLQAVITFSLFSISLIFFRAGTLDSALYMISHLFSDLGAGFHPSDTGLDRYDLLVAAAAVMAMECVHLTQETGIAERVMAASARWQRWLCYYALILSVVFFGVFEHRQFIYFQF